MSCRRGFPKQARPEKISEYTDTMQFDVLHGEYAGKIWVDQQAALWTEKKKEIGRLGVAALALVGWLGYSAYDTYIAEEEREITAVDYHAINEYIRGLSE